MSLLENFAYFIPLCVAVGVTTAATRSEDPKRMARLGLKYTASLVFGISLLAAVLMIVNAIL